MSGGFFRGTSADQDTRFSNKQAKLLKTQKFHAELEHLVDMTKVKIDVMKPWIAARVTELLGFEDEVLINFVYGLLEGKEVNGKQVQISLTGFMEKNTGKFMKELWTLLLSAQTNASGVPQQFLDAKEEETRKKKEEIERAADEIRKKREKESTELEQEKSKNMDEGDQSKAAKGDRELSSGRFMSRISNDNLDYRRDNSKRDGMRGSRRGSRSRSISRSCSNSRSYSNGQRSSRSISKSPERRRRSLTPRRRYSPRESQSPSKQRSSYYRRRSRSPYRRSPSPRRRRNYSRRSHSPVQRRSVTPVRRRSPLRRRRSPSLVRRSSPLRQRSPPMSRRSFHAVRRMSSSPKSPSSRSTSPVQGKSHLHRRSPSPVRRRSPSPVRRQSPSPTRRRPRSPVHQRLCSPVRRHQRRSRSIPKHESPPATRRSTMPGRKRSVSPLPKASDKQSSPSPIRQSSLSPAKCSVAISKIPPQSRDRKRRSSSPDVSPVRQVKNQVMHDSLNSSRRFGKHKQHPESPDTSKERSGERKTLKSTFESHISPSRIRGHADASEMRSKEKEGLRDKFSGKRDHSVISEKQMSPPLSKFSLQEKERKSQKSYSLGMKQSAKSDAAGDSIKLQKLDLVSKSVGKVDNEEGGTSDSVSEESDKGFRRKEKKRRKRSGRHEIDSESQSDDDSEAEDRKEVKKRKKEEKKLRKEGRRRRREERRRRKEEKRAEKSKTRRIDSDSSPASDEKRHSNAGRGEAEKDEKTLEIELRMKALETLKAKRSVNT